MIARTVWRIDRAGSLARLRQQVEDLPEPRPGEARVRVAAIGLNFADLFASLGLYSATPEGSFVPGLECAGVIEALGAQHAELRAGDRVIVLTRFGAYATALNARLSHLQRVPEGWSFEEAAAYPVQALTAWYGLVALGNVQRGHCVLVQSAAGGVGLNALTLLAALGARPVAVVGADSKREFLVQRAGLAHAQIVVRDPRRYAAQLDAALGAAGVRGFDLVFDAVLGPFFRPAFERLAPEGRFVLYGAADFMDAGARPSYPRLAWRYLRRPRLDPLAMISANRSLMAFNLIWLWDDAARLPQAYAAALKLIPQAPHIGARFAFEAAPVALRALQSGTSVGKIVLTVG